MNLSFHSLTSQVFFSFKDTVVTSLSQQQSKIKLITFIVIACLAAYCVFKYYDSIVSILRGRVKNVADDEAVKKETQPLHELEEVQVQVLNQPVKKQEVMAETKVDVDVKEAPVKVEPEPQVVAEKQEKKEEDVVVVNAFPSPLKSEPSLGPEKPQAKESIAEVIPTTPRKAKTVSTLNHQEKLQLSPGKVKSLKAYQKSPQKCSKVDRSMIFKDIQRMKSIPRDRYQLTSLEALLMYLSGSKEIDLGHEICEQVIVDTFKEGNKEASEQLVHWLIKEKTFHVALLSQCLAVFIEKEKTNSPFNLYALELLIKFYQDKAWHQLKNQQDQVFLPSNHPVIISAMAVLIKTEPSNDRIGGLAEWIMDQPDYDVATCSQWIAIFQQKARTNHEVATTLYYPLLNKIVAHAQGKWQEKDLQSVDPTIRSYILAK